MGLGRLILKSPTSGGCVVSLMLLIWTRAQHLRDAATRSLTKEEAILTGHLIISLDSCTIKKKELKRKRSQQAHCIITLKRSKCEVTDIVIPWKKIIRGLPKGRMYADDRAPTIEEISKLRSK